jgi:tetratricopeptide (TPR) repeat protein
MRRPAREILLAPAVLVACAGSPDGRTLADLREVEPDVAEVRVADGLDRAMHSYERFLDEAPESNLTPEAMRRLADLKIEKAYGIHGDDEHPALPAPAESESGAAARPRPASIADVSESDEDFERRAAAEAVIADEPAAALALPGGEPESPSGPLEAIALYDEILATYPNYAHNDRVLYQKARAYGELGRVDEAMTVMERLVSEHAHSTHADEVQFRRAEYFFTRKRYLEAEEAYSAITTMGTASEYYELALYKLGWTFYKQEMHEEALHQYMALLDHRVSIGTDFEQTQDEDVERRIADTFRVISLSFSYLGGPDAVRGYFTSHGQRSYEDRIYGHLGDFYLDKLRYHDAAKSYQAFVDLYPLHRASPHFGMRIVEIYEAGDFPILVLESKKNFAARYGLDAEYWRHSEATDAPEVIDYLRTNLEDLAHHYHALYQEPDRPEERAESFHEATHWYRAYLGSFPADPKTPSIHYQLADLLLENDDFEEAAGEYERTAYDYPEHDRAADAGYAAIYAHRQSQEHSVDEERDEVRRRAVESTLRFVDSFPDHEHASVVLGAAVDDLYDLEQYTRAIENGRRLIAEHPDADSDLVRGAWNVVAHSAFDLEDYAQAEEAYARALAMTPEGDESQQAVADNLAASIYKQGEVATAAEDHRGAADHFLRIRETAPGSMIRSAAEYDAAAALIRLEDWDEAAKVLEAFRETHPDHALHAEATRQIAFVYQQQGNLSRAAREYERVAAEAEDPELGREALLVAGTLHEESGDPGRALTVYQRYVERFSEPIEIALETRWKIAEMHREAGDVTARSEQLRRIVEAEATGSGERTPRVRTLAARSALVLAEALYRRFGQVSLVQPFEASLQEKQKRMDATLEAFGDLIDYEVGEVTAAATFYMAEVYFDFSQALLESERPADLSSDELLDYEGVLEEEAFPFEERSIAVHEKNLELMAAGGIYDVWIERSLARLAERMPGRYAKFEASSGALTSLDHYAYQPPGRPAGPPSPGGAAPEAEESPLDEPVPAKAAPSAEVVDSRASVESVPTLESAEQAPPKEAAMPGEVDADAP